jgi:hypothetical protein
VRRAPWRILGEFVRRSARRVEAVLCIAGATLAGYDIEIASIIERGLSGQ